MTVDGGCLIPLTVTLLRGLITFSQLLMLLMNKACPLMCGISRFR